MPLADRSTYDLIAAEYYDAGRHPTCRNFGELSERFLFPRVKALADSGIWCLEIGAGRSIVASWLLGMGLALDRLVLLDRSRAMLEHSRKWRVHGVKMFVADAGATAVRSETFALIIAALGDPYNCPAFWSEVRRILVPDGICLFTAPTLEWAERFRASWAGGEAEFLLCDGTTVAVPSNVVSVERQVEMILEAGMRIVERVDYTAAELTSPHSSKLDVFNGAPHAPIVRGFAVRKI